MSLIHISGAVSCHHCGKTTSCEPIGRVADRLGYVLVPKEEPKCICHMMGATQTGIYCNLCSRLIPYEPLSNPVLFKLFKTF